MTTGSQPPNGKATSVSLTSHHPAEKPDPGQRRHVADADRSVLRTAAGELQRLGIVDGGQRVGPGDDRRDAACRRGQPGAADAFLVTFARLADLDAPIDQTGGKAFAIAVDQFRAFGGFGIHRLDPAVAQGQRACLLGQGLGVDQAGVLKMQDHAVNSEAARPRSARRLRASRSMAAMRTATPIFT